MFPILNFVGYSVADLVEGARVSLYSVGKYNA